LKEWLNRLRESGCCDGFVLWCCHLGAVEANRGAAIPVKGTGCTADPNRGVAIPVKGASRTTAEDMTGVLFPPEEGAPTEW